LLNEPEPTMYIIPEATLLAPADNETLMQAMLAQANQMQTAVCIFDLIGGNTPDPTLWTEDISNFRNSTGVAGLKYGIAYYPFIGTTIMQNSDIDFTNLFGGDTKQLAPLINPAANPDPVTGQILGIIQNPPAKPLSNTQCK